VRCHISAACIQNAQGVNRLNSGIAPAESPLVRRCGISIGVGDLSCSFQLSIRPSIILVCALEICSKKSRAVAKKDGVSQTDIVNATGIDRSTTAELVTRLVKKGWLQRRRAKDDARAYAVRLTAAGKKAMKIGEGAYLEADEKVLASLSSAQRAKLIKASAQLYKSWARQLERQL
jgi:DNA-binding MarR family transcriptional regulator